MLVPRQLTEAELKEIRKFGAESLLEGVRSGAGGLDAAGEPDGLAGHAQAGVGVPAVGVRA